MCDLDILDIQIESRNEENGDVHVKKISIFPLKIYFFTAVLFQTNVMLICQYDHAPKRC